MDSEVSKLYKLQFHSNFFRYIRLIGKIRLAYFALSLNKITWRIMSQFPNNRNLKKFEKKQSRSYWDCSLAQHGTCNSTASTSRTDFNSTHFSCFASLFVFFLLNEQKANGTEHYVFKTVTKKQRYNIRNFL